MPTTELSPNGGPERLINKGEAMEARDNDEIEGFEVEVSGDGDVVFAHTEQDVKRDGGRKYPPGREGVMDPKGRPLFAKAVGGAVTVQVNRAGFAFNLFPSVSLNSLDFVSTVDTINSVTNVDSVAVLNHADDLQETATVATGLDETASQEESLNLSGRNTVEVYAEASTGTDFYLDVSPDGSYWISGINPSPDIGSWGASTRVMWGGFIGFPYARLRSDAAGAAGDTVDLILGGTR